MLKFLYWAQLAPTICLAFAAIKLYQASLFFVLSCEFIQCIHWTFYFFLLAISVAPFWVCAVPWNCQRKRLSVCSSWHDGSTVTSIIQVSCFPFACRIRGRTLRHFLTLPQLQSRIYDVTGLVLFCFQSGL